MNFPHLVNNNFRDGKNNLEYAIQEYVASYLKVNEAGVKIWSNMPNWYNFLEEDRESEKYSGYGFRLHSWDNNGLHD